jgi:PAS domain S-box-containing protein
MSSPTDALARENEELRYQLEEAQELIQAIRTGAVDALAVQGAEGPRIFTLQGADQGYRTLIEQMNEGALLLSADGTVLYANAGLASLLERDLSEVIGSRFEGVVPARYEEYWTGLVGRGWAGKSRGELPLQTPTGSLVSFAFSTNVLLFNDVAVLAVIVTDLSAQREIRAIEAQVVEQNLVIDRKNEELRQQEAARQEIERAAAEARRMLEGIPHIAWTANPQGVITYLNQRWYDYTGHTGQLGLPEQWLLHLHPADTEGTNLHLTHCLDTGDAFEVEFRFSNRDGAYRWMLGRALPSRNALGEIMQWIGTCTDIHEHRLALERIDLTQRMLRENNAQLTRVNVDLDNFIYTASHDLKAPISNIEGLLTALLVELPPDAVESEQVEPILHLMQESVNRFKRTIEQLTDVSKLQKEHGQPTAPVDMAAIIHDVRLDLEPLIQSTAATVEVDVAEVPTVLFSEKNLRSVVFNLLSNALKYRSPSRLPHVQLRTRQEGEFVVFEVTDNGLGLDIANKRKLFGMFQRFHDHVEGSGIGLYMLKKMVENAGGHISVRSELGIGSIFLVYFPR